MPVTPPLSYPGVYIQELPSGVRSVVGVPTSITAFLGRAPRGLVNEPVMVTNFGDYERSFGGLDLNSTMSYAVRDFFLNGGGLAIIVRLFNKLDKDTAAKVVATKAASAKAAADSAVAAKAAADSAAAAKAAADNAATAKAAAAKTPDDAAAKDAAAKAASASTAADKAAADKAAAAKTAAAAADTATAAAAAAVPADVEFQASGAVGDGVDQWQILAASPGTWANGLQIRVTFVPADGMGGQVLERYGCQAGELFGLSIHNGDPDKQPAIETIANVTLKEGQRRLDRVLGQELGLIRVEKLGTTTPDFDFTLTLDGGKDSENLDAVAYQGSEADKTGLYALEKADLFNLLCIPPDQRDGDVDPSIYAPVLAYCTKRRAMFIVDPPISWAARKETAAAQAKGGIDKLNISGEIARNASLYFPRVVEADPLRENQPDVFPACGIVAGVMARTDATRGVWKAPAGQDATLTGIRSLQANLNDAENGQLNPLGINCLRTFPTIGSVLWGSRTLRGADQLADDYKYVPVRRLALFLEETLYRSTQWAVFEPNDEPLWSQLRLNIGVFMHDLFRQGAFQGQKPGDAYFVQCDSTTTTQSDINKGIVNIIVGFAPLKPAEFVVIYLQQMAGNLAA